MLGVLLNLATWMELNQTMTTFRDIGLLAQAWEHRLYGLCGCETQSQ